MKSSLTIKSRLFFVIVAIIGCSYAILFSLSITTIQRIIEEETVKNLEHSLLFAKSQFNARPELVLAALKLSASTPSVQKLFLTADRNGLEKTALLWAKSLDFLEILTVVDSDSNVITRINGLKDPESFLRGEMLNSLFELKQPFITTELVSHEEFCLEVSSDVCKSLSDNKDVMVKFVLLPVIDPGGKVLGIIVAGDKVNKDPNFPYPQQKVFGKTIDVFVTQSGERIASTIAADFGVSSELEPRVLQSLKNGFPFHGSTILNSHEYEVTAEPLHNHKGEFIGSIAVALGKSRFYNIRNDNFRNLIISGSISIALILGLAYLTAWKFTVPLRRFADAVRDIEDENRSETDNENSRFEFNDLTGTFNRITETIIERDYIIKCQNFELAALKEDLEKTVFERAQQFETETAVHKSIIKSIMDGLVVTDRKQMVIELNPAAEQLFGVRASDLLGESLSTFCRQLGLSELEGLLTKDSANGTSINETVVVLKHNRRRLRFAVTDVKTEAGTNGFLLGIRDVTADGEVDRLKNGFIAKVSHELKTPLTSMKGSLQFILKMGKWLTGAERDMLGICLRNTERLIGFVASILELSRIDAGQMIFSMRPVQIGEVVLYAIEEIKGTAQLKNISIVNDVPMDLPKVYGDYERLTRVLSELLSNAAKFTPEDSIVTLSATIEKGFLALSVADGARLIPAEQRETLFSRFQQIGLPEDGNFSGSGLGLAISKEVIDRHGGSIFHSQGAAGGNVFTIKVPLYGEFNGT